MKKTRHSDFCLLILALTLFATASLNATPEEINPSEKVNSALNYFLADPKIPYQVDRPGENCKKGDYKELYETFLGDDPPKRRQAYLCLRQNMTFESHLWLSRKLQALQNEPMGENYGLAFELEDLLQETLGFVRTIQSKGEITFSQGVAQYVNFGDPTTSPPEFSYREPFAFKARACVGSAEMKTQDTSYSTATYQISNVLARIRGAIEKVSRRPITSLVFRNYDIEPKFDNSDSKNGWARETLPLTLNMEAGLDVYVGSPGEFCNYSQRQAYFEPILEPFRCKFECTCVSKSPSLIQTLYTHPMEIYRKSDLVEWQPFNPEENTKEPANALFLGVCQDMCERKGLKLYRTQAGKLEDTIAASFGSVSCENKALPARWDNKRDWRQTKVFAKKPSVSKRYSIQLSIMNPMPWKIDVIFVSKSGKTLSLPNVRDQVNYNFVIGDLVPGDHLIRIRERAQIPPPPSPKITASGAKKIDGRYYQVTVDPKTSPTPQVRFTLQEE